MDEHVCVLTLQVRRLARKITRRLGSTLLLGKILVLYQYINLKERICVTKHDKNVLSDHKQYTYCGLHF